MKILLMALGLICSLSFNVGAQNQWGPPLEKLEVGFSECSSLAPFAKDIISCTKIILKGPAESLKRLGFATGEVLPTPDAFIAPRSWDPHVKPWLNFSSFLDFGASARDGIIDFFKEGFVDSERLLKNYVPFSVVQLTHGKETGLLLIQGYYDEYPIFYDRVTQDLSQPEVGISTQEVDGTLYLLPRLLNGKKECAGVYNLQTCNDIYTFVNSEVNEQSMVFAVDRTETQFNPVIGAVKTFKDLKTLISSGFVLAGIIKNTRGNLEQAPLLAYRPKWLETTLKNRGKAYTMDWPPSWVPDWLKTKKSPVPAQPEQPTNEPPTIQPPLEHRVEPELTYVKPKNAADVENFFLALSGESETWLRGEVAKCLSETSSYSADVCAWLKNLLEHGGITQGRTIFMSAEILKNLKNYRLHEIKFMAFKFRGNYIVYVFTNVNKEYHFDTYQRLIELAEEKDLEFVGAGYLAIDGGYEGISLRYDSSTMREISEFKRDKPQNNAEDILRELREILNKGINEH